MIDDSENPENYLIKRLEYQEVFEAIKKLKPRHALYINMKFCQNLSDDCIAIALGVKEDSLRMLSARARAELKKITKKGHTKDGK